MMLPGSRLNRTGNSQSGRREPRHWVSAVITGSAQAVVGGFGGVVLFVFIAANLDATTPDQHAGPTLENLVAAIQIATIGVLSMIWWIVPVGALFGVFAKPRMRKWPARTAWLKGALTGISLGSATAALFAISVMSDERPSHKVVTELYIFLPFYCGVWSAIYAMRSAAHGADRRPTSSPKT